jgi:hypothetical protein
LQGIVTRLLLIPLFSGVPELSLACFYGIFPFLRLKYQGDGGEEVLAGGWFNKVTFRCELF